MPKVTFNGETVEVEEGADLKEVAREHGWPIMFACEDGVCGTCIVNTTAGMENLSQVEEVEGETLNAMGMDPKEQRLACQCKVNGDVTLEQ
jgi:ferredoxin